MPVSRAPRSALMIAVLLVLILACEGTLLAGRGETPQALAAEASEPGGLPGVDPRPALSAQLGNPTGVAVDAAGDLYVVELASNQVRRVDPSGTIMIVAGSGEQGFSGDGGPATAARLDHPLGLAVDAGGNLYIADTGNHRVRRVDRSGTITTVAGSTRGFGGDGGPATAAQLNGPIGIAVDPAGNVYIGDTVNHRVRRIDPAGMITTVAGSGVQGFGGDGGPATAAQLNGPVGITVDAEGNLYIADPNPDPATVTDTHRVRRVDRFGTITTVAGSGIRGSSGDGGVATAARLYGPWGVAVDAEGNLYIVELANHQVRRVDPSGTIMTVAGSGVPGLSGEGGVATQARLAGPWGVAVDADGNVYIADTVNNLVRRVDRSGRITTVAGRNSANRLAGAGAR